MKKQYFSENKNSIKKSEFWENRKLICMKIQEFIVSNKKYTSFNEKYCRNFQND